MATAGAALVRDPERYLQGHRAQEQAVLEKKETV
jgi:hypothetical protein